MLKYLYTKQIFSEIPGEITLGISISGCQIHCNGCHSRELWEDKGTQLTRKRLESLIIDNQGITCLLLLGGEHDIENLINLFYYVSVTFPKIKTAWYCGLDMIPKDKEEILDYLDYVKTGHFDINLGGLDSKDTNQKLYEIKHTPMGNELNDITYKFWNKNTLINNNDNKNS